MFYYFYFPKTKHQNIQSEHNSCKISWSSCIEHLYVGNLLWDKIFRSGLAVAGVMIDTPVELGGTNCHLDICVRSWLRWTLRQTRIPTWPFHYQIFD